MKKFVFFLSILFIGLNVSAKDGATISFGKKIHDFGQISENDNTATCEFEFKNSGNSTLAIHKAVASCGCTTPIYPREPIAPGGTGTIKVTYNTVGRPGAFHKTVTIYSNDQNTPNVVLIIKGNVIPKDVTVDDLYPKNIQGLRLKKTNVSMLEAKIGSSTIETIEVINTNKTPMSLSFSKVPRHIKVISSKSVLKPNETGVLTIKYTPALTKDFGKREDSFYISTNSKIRFNPENRIKVNAVITEDFARLTAEQRNNAAAAFFSDYRIDYGKMTGGSNKSAVITLSNKGKMPLYIRKIVPEYDGIKVTMDSKTIPAGKSIQVKIDFNAGTFNGSVVKAVSFIMNDPRNSTHKIFLTAQVSPK